MSKLNLFLVGEVSTGKSSFLNAMAGGIVSSSSIQRETFNPELYEFSPAGKEENVEKLSLLLEKIHAENQEKRIKIDSLKEEDIAKIINIAPEINLLPARFGFNNMSITDFPGINDAEDKDNKFTKAIEANIGRADIIVFLTRAEHAFVNAAEVEIFNRLKHMVEQEKNRGHYMDLVVVINKFDDIRDEDLNQIASRIPDRIGLDQSKIFRCSSHKMLVGCIVQHSLNLYVPKFYSTEIQRIMRGANVSTNRKMKTKLQKTGKIAFDDIEYHILEN